MAIMKNDPPQGCAELDTISAAGTLDDVRTRARNQAAEKGANYLRLDAVRAHGRELTGTAYVCPETGRNVGEAN